MADGIKYRRISKDDTEFAGYFGNCNFRYFKWEKINWRVLWNDSKTLFVMPDKGIDCKAYKEALGTVPGGSVPVVVIQIMVQKSMHGEGFFLLVTIPGFLKMPLYQ